MEVTLQLVIGLQHTWFCLVIDSDLLFFFVLLFPSIPLAKVITFLTNFYSYETFFNFIEIF